MTYVSEIPLSLHKALLNNCLQAYLGIKRELQVNISETDKSVYTAN